MTHKTASNWRLYSSRTEPRILRNTDGSYINLRTCDDPTVSNRLEAMLANYAKKSGDEHVVVPWLSPPFGRIVGYGIYTKRQARELIRMSSEEKWGFPRPGRIYDGGLLLSYLKTIKNSGSGTALQKAC